MIAAKMEYVNRSFDTQKTPHLWERFVFIFSVFLRIVRVNPRVKEF